MEEHKNKNRHSNEIEIPVKTVVTIVTVIVVIVLGFLLFNSGVLSTGKAVSETEAKANLINFFNTQVPESSVQIISISKQISFYEIIVNLDEETFPVYVTLDGKFLVVDRIPLK